MLADKNLSETLIKIYPSKTNSDFPGMEIILRLKNLGMFDIHPNLLQMLLLEPQLKLVNSYYLFTVCQS